MIKIRIKKSLNEAMIILETRRARNWIAQQHPFFHKDLLRAYNVGATNIPDLSFIQNTHSKEILQMVADSEAAGDMEYTLEDFTGELEIEGGVKHEFKNPEHLRTYYDPKVRKILRSNGINQISDFDNARFDFEEFMEQMNIEFLVSDEEAEGFGDKVQPEGFKSITQIGDFELIDPNTGEGSAACAVGTDWCTQDAQTYRRYTDGELSLYYVFNDNLEYPNDKIAIGVKNNKIRYGGDAGITVKANNDGIGSVEELEKIFGGETAKIVNTLKRYYSASDKSKQRLNYISFLQKIKDLPTAPKLQYYDDVLTSIINNDKYMSQNNEQPHMLRIIDKILKDKELDKMKFYPELKKKIKQNIQLVVYDRRFGSRISIKDKNNYYDLIESVLIDRYEGTQLGWKHIFDILLEKYNYEKEDMTEEVVDRLKKAYNLAKASVQQERIRLEDEIKDIKERGMQKKIRWP